LGDGNGHTIFADMLATPKTLRFAISPGQIPVVRTGAVPQVIASAGFCTWLRPAAGDNQVAPTWIPQREEQPRIRALDADHANEHHHASVPFLSSSSELSDQGLTGDRPAASRPTAPTGVQDGGSPAGSDSIDASATMLIVSSIDVGASTGFDAWWMAGVSPRSAEAARFAPFWSCCSGPMHEVLRKAGESH
jgi:hypothetical protein